MSEVQPFRPLPTHPADEEVSPAHEARTMAEILADPDAFRPPEVVLPRLAWSGCVTVLAAREKHGKSTLAAAGTSAVSAGSWWLGDPTTAERVLWVAPEEALTHVVQRFQAAGADPEMVWILDRAPQPLEDLTREVTRLEPGLVVVDTLASWAGAHAPDSGDARGWTALLLPVVHLARDSGAAFLLLHHAAKADGSYRDSTAIGALADVLAEMREGEQDGERKVRVRARWPVEDYAVRLVEGGRFELAGGELSVDLRVVMAIEREPGLSKRKVCDRVTGKRDVILATVDRLLERGALENRGTEHSSALFAPVPDPKPAGEREGNGQGTVQGTVTDEGPFPDPSPYRREGVAGNASLPSSGGDREDTDEAAYLEAEREGMDQGDLLRS